MYIWAKPLQKVITLTKLILTYSDFLGFIGSVHNPNARVGMGGDMDGYGHGAPVDPRMRVSRREPDPRDSTPGDVGGDGGGWYDGYYTLNPTTFWNLLDPLKPFYPQSSTLSSKP